MADCHDFNDGVECLWCLAKAVTVPVTGTHLVIDGQIHTNLVDMAFIVDRLRAQAKRRREGGDND